jgi:Domain of unknown function (DUF4258)
LEFTYTHHALTEMSRRNIDAEWIERKLRNPERIEADPLRVGVYRYNALVPERGDRWLRVAAVPIGGFFRVVTAMLDRGERKRSAR